MSELKYLQGTEEWSNSTPHTQVYMATHDGADKRLPHRERSFISFTYGGQHIEDFSLIATVKGDRMERTLYGDFQDNTSTYDVIDGQFYWGSHFTTNKLELQLSTDEMTEQELQRFKHWFQPGKGKELVLAEYPNRAINARINKTPEYHLLPFEKRVKQKFAGNLYEISTTVYRGNIDLEFVMDDPFWYSIYNILPSYGQDGAENWFRTLGINLTDNAKNNSLMANKDYLKIILEDGVPTREMFSNVPNIITGDVIHNVSQAPIAGGNGYIGSLVGVRLASSSLSLQKLENNEASAYLYYTGSAPAPTILSFDILPRIDNGYISQPWNKIYNQVAVNSGETPTDANYNTITIGRQEFKFTTPSLYTGYNQAMDIITTVPEGTSTIDLHILLNDGVNEYYSRSWALGILNYLKAFQIGIDLKTSQITNAVKFRTNFKTMMRRFLDIKTGGTEEEPDYSIMPASFMFNSKTGLSTGKFKIRKFTDESIDKWDELARYKEQWNVRIKLKENWITNATLLETPDYSLTAAEESLTEFEERPLNQTVDYGWLLFNAGFDMLDTDGNYLFSVKPFMDYTEEYEVIENVGDMVYSKYLYLDERNLYNSNGMITPAECTPISTDYPAGDNHEYELKNFDIQYKHMYL